MPGSIDIVDRSRQAVTARASWVSDTGSDVAVVSAAVGPAYGPATQVVVQTPLTQGSWAAANVVVPGGRSSVWETAGGPGGQSYTACVPYTSSHWYFAGGDGDGGDHLYFALYNPLSTDAVADIALVGVSGALSDTSLEGLFVPAGRMVVEDVSSRVFAEGPVAATVTCRVGRVVAYQLELRPPSPATVTSAVPGIGTGAVSVTPGAPTPGDTWYFPEGATAASGPEFLDIYNPGSAPVTARVSIALDAGTASPLVERILPESVAVLDTSTEARIPASVGQTVEVQVTSGPPIVAFQTEGTPPPPQDATAVITASAGGSANPWLSTVLGARQAASTWVLAAFPQAGATGPTVAIENPGRHPLVAVVGYEAKVGCAPQAFGCPSIDLSRPQRVTVPPGGHALVSVPSLPVGANPAPFTMAPTTSTFLAAHQVAGAGVPIVVRANGPVIAEEQWISVPHVPGWFALMGVIG